MQIGGDQLGLNPEDLLVMIDSFGVSCKRFLIFEITDMVTEEGVVLALKRKGVFQMGAGC